MGISYPAPERAEYGEITPQKYAALLVVLQAHKDASDFQHDSAGSGSVTYQKIGFSWIYFAAESLLQVTITADHNWKAKIAGNQAIFGILNDELISKL